MNSKEQFMQKTIVVWLGAMFCYVLCGSAYPCVKIGCRMFAIASSNVASLILFAGCRFTLAGVLAHTTGVKASIIEGVNVFIAILVALLLVCVGIYIVNRPDTEENSKA